MKNNVLDRNKTITDFMGLKTVKKLSPLSFEYVLFIKVYNEATKIWDNELPRYDSSWDWIMPVWIKFIGLSLKSDEYEQWVYSLSWYLYSSDTPYRFFDRLIYAIKWYTGSLITEHSTSISNKKTTV